MNNSIGKLKNILLFVFLIMLVWGIALQIQEDKNTPWNFLFNSGYGLLFFISGLATLFLRKKEAIEGFPKKTLILFSLSLISYSIALFLWTIYNFIYGVSSPYPSWPDLFFVLFNILLASAIFCFLKIFSIFFTKRLFLESSVVFIFLSFLIVTNIGTEIISEEGYLINFLNLFYPLASAFLLSSSFILVRIGGLSIKKSSFILSLGLFLMGLSDVLFSFREKNETYWNGDISDVIAMISAFVLGMTAIKIIEDLTFKKND